MWAKRAAWRQEAGVMAHHTPQPAPRQQAGGFPHAPLVDGDNGLRERWPRQGGRGVANQQASPQPVNVLSIEVRVPPVGARRVGDEVVGETL
jgi:hypothetical protein